MSMVQARQVGRFSIPLAVFDDHEEVVQTVLGTTIVVEAKANFVNRAIDYVGYCTAFAEVPEGEEPPLYDMNINDDGAVVWAQL